MGVSVNGTQDPKIGGSGERTYQAARRNRKEQSQD